MRAFDRALWGRGVSLARSTIARTQLDRGSCEAAVVAAFQKRELSLFRGGCQGRVVQRRGRRSIRAQARDRRTCTTRDALTRQQYHRAQIARWCDLASEPGFGVKARDRRLVQPRRDHVARCPAMRPRRARRCFRLDRRRRWTGSHGGQRPIGSMPEARPAGVDPARGDPLLRCPLAQRHGARRSPEPQPLEHVEGPVRKRPRPLRRVPLWKWRIGALEIQ